MGIYYTLYAMTNTSDRTTGKHSYGNLVTIAKFDSWTEAYTQLVQEAASFLDTHIESHVVSMHDNSIGISYDIDEPVMKYREFMVIKNKP